MSQCKKRETGVKSTTGTAVKQKRKEKNPTKINKALIMLTDHQAKAAVPPGATKSLLSPRTTYSTKPRSQQHAVAMAPTADRQANK